MAQAGSPQAGPDADSTSFALQAGNIADGQFAVLPAVTGTRDGIPFVTIVARVHGEAHPGGLVFAVHTVSINSPASYIPTSYWQTDLGGATQPAHVEDLRRKYDLEVVSPDGLTVLGIGEDERPGEVSPHFQALQGTMAAGKAATLVHKESAGGLLRTHVMAAVPLAPSRFYMVLEQPVDVALALPNRLRQELLLVASLGFLATLLVAWVTTRHVVKPTEQLTKAAQRMAQGDLETPINISAQDEVGKLARSLDTMRQKLMAASRQIEQTNKELESLVKERTARLGEVLRKVISSQEEERYRLARELHDETAQTLGALSIALDRIRDGLQDAPSQTVAQLSEAKSIASRLLEETRRLILDLRPMALDDLGLGPAIRWYAETHLEEQGVATTVEVDQLASRLPAHIEVSLFRIVQEAVNNIAKHARARHASIRLAFQDSVASVVVRDDGRGFDVERAVRVGTPSGSVGILGMQERVRLLNGHMQIRSEEGKGTEVAIQIPISAEES